MQHSQEDTPDILLLRHGKSLFNEGESEYFNSNPHMGWNEIKKNISFNDAVLYSPKFVDCSLSEKGRKECALVREQLRNEHIDIVLVSPLRRALQTAQLIFGDRKIKIQVHPELTEAFKYGCDLSDPISVKKDEFKGFDFSQMEKATPHWYLQHLSESNQRYFRQWKEKNPKTSFMQEQAAILKMLAEDKIYESEEETSLRAVSIVKLLAKAKQGHKRVAVVSHYYTLQAVGGSLLKHTDIRNAWPYWMHFSRLKSMI